jgi:hypothetical protein
VFALQHATIHTRNEYFSLFGRVVPQKPEIADVEHSVVDFRTGWLCREVMIIRTLHGK